MSASIVHHALTLWAADRPETPVHALLTYDADDPYAARLTFMKDGRATVDYLFGRDLLEAGLYDPAGEGNVIVGPHETHDPFLVLTVTPDVGYPIAFYIGRAQVTEYLDRSYRLVPMGCEREHIPAWDAELAEVLGGAA